MKLLKFDLHRDVEIYTTLADDNGINGNMSFNGIDDNQVRVNRSDVMKQLGSDNKYMVATLQMHTDKFIEVSLADGGKGIDCRDSAIFGYDGMYTKDADLFLWSFHADCTPVMIYCEDKKIIAEVHSGWKGTVQEIAGKMTRHLIEYEKCDPKRIYAYIGPAIEYRNFEARDDIINMVQSMSFDTSSFYTLKDDGAYLLNGKGLIKQQLLNLGVLQEHIHVSPYCTIENDDMFFSYRKTKTADRNITMIKRKG